MFNVRIFKFDGAIQGYPESQASSVALMRRQLAALLGEDAIVSMWKARLRMKACPGMPAGSINVYVITALAWFTLERHGGDAQGFQRLADWHDRVDAQMDFAALSRRLSPARPEHPLRTFSRNWAAAR